MSDLAEALKYANTMFQRGILGIASALYALFVLLAPSLANRADVVLSSAADTALAAAAGVASISCQAVMLSNSQRLVIAGAFALNSACIFWRIFDSRPRIWWARGINFSTACLWVTVTAATLFVYGRPLPGAVGEIMLTITALYTLTRTDFNDRDRRSA